MRTASRWSILTFIVASKKYSDSKKYRGYITKNVTKRTVTIKKLDRKTKFYFKVRAYTKVGTKKVYGAWSKTKSVKVK